MGALQMLCLIVLCPDCCFVNGVNRLRGSSEGEFEFKVKKVQWKRVKCMLLGRGEDVRGSWIIEYSTLVAL